MAPVTRDCLCCLAPSLPSTTGPLSVYDTKPSPQKANRLSWLTEDVSCVFSTSVSIAHSDIQISTFSSYPLKTTTVASSTSHTPSKQETEQNNHVHTGTIVPSPSQKLINTDRLGNNYRSYSPAEQDVLNPAIDFTEYEGIWLFSFKQTKL